MTTDQFRIHQSITEIPALAWDTLAGAQPFLKHAFLHALESSACVGGQTGWTPMHAALWRGHTLLAAMPLYAKQHSYGEYVFDWAWADTYARHGLPYYPKLLCAIPFTPVPGLRLLGRTPELRSRLLGHVIELARELRFSSFHLLYPESEDIEYAKAQGLLVRRNVEFHWASAGERDFEDFLARLRHEKRKKIRQERRKVAAAGIEFESRSGHEIRAEDWIYFTRCYRTTYALHGSSPYLNLEFFRQIGAMLPESCVMILAHQNRRRVGASLMLRDKTALYGRYWGATDYIPCLHFETCYYQGIEYAITHGLQRFEGGAQGEHKLARGLEPVATASAHWIADPRFRHAIADFLLREHNGMEIYFDELNERRPFKANSDHPSTP
ncbi:MAG: GNAT family N-acetyltransferase [Betaproteobacteria bacterium]|nr:GNAT family N-acetyltransferase [Betaproteobacteria bacterium]